MSDSIDVLSVTDKDVEKVALLFDAYRVWYGAASDLNGARSFLTQRLRQNESVIFLAVHDGVPAGFTQLYPVFSSVSMAHVWILNDLFVSEASRRLGIGTLLLETAAEFGRETGAIRLELQTGIHNFAAQAAYHNHGWISDNEFLRYSLPLA